ncbi:MAG: YmdB family metallophosphoesterase, partial [Vicinamibacteria bacterium]
MKLLFIGDIVARPGRELVRQWLRPLVDRYDVDVVLANGENAAGGAGITREITSELLKAGIDVLTSGN